MERMSLELQKNLCLFFCVTNFFFFFLNNSLINLTIGVIMGAVAVALNSFGEKNGS
tara:strand:+ start:378 stop:545 length:168 start_codon:yes stop_codon:yes gene_type:complete